MPAGLAPMADSGLLDGFRGERACHGFAQPPPDVDRVPAERRSP